MAKATLTNRMRIDNHSRGHDPILSDAFFNVYETTGPGMGDDKP
ncbi:hypothetical protein [Rhizobium ruizarguesonis]|jgi:hypothetical protein|nr:hypothetical protein [Rhizobium ruizarguesonis]